MFEQSLFRISLRLLTAWLGLSALGFFFGKEIIAPLLPFVSWIVGLIEPGVSALVTVQQHEGNEMVHLSATTLRSLEISKSLVIPEGLRLTAAGSLVHALVPLVILWSLIIAWPATVVREKVSLLLLSLPATLITVALTTPFLLAGRVEIMFSEMAYQRGEQREEPFALTWLLFTEGGGRWLLPIVMAACCILLARWMFSLRGSR
jgi:hypothetical protein